MSEEPETRDDGRGRRDDFVSPRPSPASRAPSTWARIYAVVRQIPTGCVGTYGQVAELAGLPRQARLVGYALSALSADAPIPWHRVVNAQGRVSARAEGPGGTILQRVRLEQEGVVFGAGGRVSLEQYGWAPRESRCAAR